MTSASALVQATSYIIEAAPDIPRPTTVSHTATAGGPSDAGTGISDSGAVNANGLGLPARGLASELAQVPVEDDRQGADPDIRDGGEQERGPDAQCRDEMETCSVGSQHGAERVQGV